MRRRVVTMGLVLLVAAVLPGSLVAQGAEPVGPDTVVFTPKRGAVTFAHRKHAEALDCVSCHHASKPEKPLTAAKEACRSCHTNPATEPMKTTSRMAIHDTAAKEGTCYSCHNKEAAAGKAVPQKCADCHKQEGQ